MIEISHITLTHVNSVPGLLEQALRDTSAVPGGMPRPACIMLFGASGSDAGQKHDKPQKIATSIETPHNTTLIHDDIIDESNIRHGRLSIQTKYSRHIAVYTDDYLVVLPLTPLSESVQNLHSVIADGKTMQNILVGEIERCSNAYNIGISEKECLDQIKGRTSVLFGLTCSISVCENGTKVTKVAKTLKAKEFREYLGQTFRLKDDILDYTATGSVFRKPVLLDVKDGIYSGPLIFALQNDDNNHLHELVKMGKDPTQDQLHGIENLVNRLGGVERAQKLADQYTGKALTSLKEHWPDNENRALIGQLVGRLLKRQY